MAKYAQIEDLKNGEIFRVVEETAGEVYFYDEFRRWCYFNKSEEGVNYRYIPAGVRLTRRAADGFKAPQMPDNMLDEHERALDIQRIFSRR